MALGWKKFSLTYIRHWTQSLLVIAKTVKKFKNTSKAIDAQGQDTHSRFFNLIFTLNS